MFLHVGFSPRLFPKICGSFPSSESLYQRFFLLTALCKENSRSIMGSATSNAQKSETQTQTQTQTQTSVVVVGGGYGGASCAMKLKKNGVPFKLVDSKNFFHHNIGGLRSAVDPDFLKKTMIPYKESFGDDFVEGRVTSVDLGGKKVTLDNKKQVDFSHLILATGSVGVFPAKLKESVRSRQEVEEMYKSIAEEIEKVESIVIIGGGPVGIEMAGEILDKYSYKKLTLLHSGPSLLSRSNMGAKVQEKARALLEGKGVDVKLGEQVANIDKLTFNKCVKQRVATEKGKTVEADMVLFCVGLKPASDLIGKAFDPSKFDGENRLKVNSFNQVEGYDNVFAIGDCCNTKEEKMAAHATFQGELLADNIAKAIKGGQMKPYKSMFTGMFVPVGAKDGTGVANGWTLPAFAVSMFKGKDLLTKMYWGKLGQKVPN